MCFVTIDDLYGSFEVIVFESVFNRCSSAIEEEKIVLVEGRLSIREDEPTKIVASNIKELIAEDNAISKITVNITDFSDEKKQVLRDEIHNYAKYSNAETQMYVAIQNEIRSCGKIFADKTTVTKWKELFGESNVIVSIDN